MIKLVLLKDLSRERSKEVVAVAATEWEISSHLKTYSTTFSSDMKCLKTAGDNASNSSVGLVRNIEVTLRVNLIQHNYSNSSAPSYSL